MELRSFVSAANAASINILIRASNGGYFLRADFKKETLVCTNRAGDPRRWVSVDTIIKHLNDAKFSGDLILNISQQGELL